MHNYLIMKGTTLIEPDYYRIEILLVLYNIIYYSYNANYCFTKPSYSYILQQRWVSLYIVLLLLKVWLYCRGLTIYQL